MKILKYIWQLPQHIVALILILYYRYKKYGCMKSPYQITLGKVTKINIYKAYMRGPAISLGNYIITNPYDYQITDMLIRHEYGHQRQSLYLGPLYLLVIGIPSLVGNIWDANFHKNWPPLKSYKWYYNQPWEKWADKLGGVNRCVNI